ncbi:MAG: hypothetical protein GY805_18170 [Chloroflexi bacterium]|nr:hypothetical protein [Chloroflexota bacterium]
MAQPDSDEPIAYEDDAHHDEKPMTMVKSSPSAPLPKTAANHVDIVNNEDDAGRFDDDDDEYELDAIDQLTGLVIQMHEILHEAELTPDELALLRQHLLETVELLDTPAEGV